MAKKTFGELKGVLLEVNDSNGEVVKTSPCKEKYGNFTYKLLYNGDPLFVVDVESMTIRTCIVKYVRIRYYPSITVTIGYCDKNKNVAFMPTHDEIRGYSKTYNIEIVHLLANKSQYGIYATTLTDALAILNRLREHNAFIFAKEGDNLFVTNRDSNTVEKLTIRRISYLKNNDNSYNDKIKIVFTDNSEVKMGFSKFCSKSSEHIDYEFSLRMRGKYTNCLRYFVYTTENEAVNDLNSMIKRREAAKKKVKKEFEKGCEIKLKDCKGNVLHVGDTVAYVRKSGQAALMGIGVVVKETKALVQVFDEEEREHVRESRKERNKQYANSQWHRQIQVEREDDGYHYVFSGRLILMNKYIKK